MLHTKNLRQCAHWRCNIFLLLHKWTHRIFGGRSFRQELKEIQVIYKCLPKRLAPADMQSNPQQQLWIIYITQWRTGRHLHMQRKIYLMLSYWKFGAFQPLQRAKATTKGNSTPFSDSGKINGMVQWPIVWVTKMLFSVHIAQRSILPQNHGTCTYYSHYIIWDSCFTCTIVRLHLLVLAWLF